MAARFASAFYAMSVTRKAAASHAFAVRAIAFILLRPFCIILRLVGFIFGIHRITITTRLRVVCCAVCVRFGLFRIVTFRHSIGFTCFCIGFSISNVLLCAGSILLTFCDTRFRLRNGLFNFAVIVRLRLLRCSNLVIGELLGVVELALNAIEQTTGKIVAPLVA